MENQGDEAVVGVLFLDADLFDVGIRQGHGIGQLGNHTPLALQVHLQYDREFVGDVLGPAEMDDLVILLAGRRRPVTGFRVNDHAAAGVHEADDGVTGNRLAAVGETQQQAIGAFNGDTAPPVFAFQRGGLVLGQGFGGNQLPGDDVRHPVPQANLCQQVVKGIHLVVPGHMPLLGFVQVRESQPETRQ